MTILAAPTVKKSRVNCPRQGHTTHAAWIRLFDLEPDLCKKRDWNTLSRLWKIPAATIASAHGKIHPTGFRRTVVSKNDFLLRQTDWTQQEIDTLVQAVKIGESPLAISDALSRTVVACESKYLKIQQGHIPTPAEPRMVSFREVLNGYRTSEKQEAKAKKDLKTIRAMMDTRSVEGIAVVVGWKVSDVNRAVDHIKEGM
jgi:hypothetical protein